MPAPSKPNASVATDEINCSQPVETPSSSDTQDSKDSLNVQTNLNSIQHGKPRPIEQDIDGLSQAVRDAHLTDTKVRESPGVSGDAQENGALKRETSFEDDRTHLSNSSTKPTSFDSKSMASVATFALDEKDSLRPDDSASVQAVDEDESLSGAASGAPNSLTGSESGARGFRDTSIQKSRAILQNASSVYHDGGQRSNGAAPDYISNNYILSNPGSFQGGGALHGFPQDPDEKLLEAMKSPKDRLLILQLEDKVRHFIQHSKYVLSFFFFFFTFVPNPQRSNLLHQRAILRIAAFERFWSTSRAQTRRLLSFNSFCG